MNQKLWFKRKDKPDIGVKGICNYRIYNTVLLLTGFISQNLTKNGENG